MPSGTSADADEDVVAHSMHDPQAFAVVFDRYFPVIHRYLARRTGAHDADDLASETFVVAYAKRASFDPRRGQVLSWLYGIATNLLRNHQRKVTRESALLPRLQVLDVVDPVDGAAVGAVDAEARLAALSPGLGRLSRDDRDTLLLYAWEDLTYQEVAEALHIPVGTVRSRLNRIRRRLLEPFSADPTSTQ